MNGKRVSPGLSLLCLTAIAVAACASSGAGTPGPAQNTPVAIQNTSVSSPTPAPAARSRWELVEIPALALANNALRDPDHQQAAVYLPPSYDVSGRRYPVVYFLTMFGQSATSPRGYPALQAVMDRLEASGQAPEMLVAVVSGLNSLGGSFYTNSPVAGNWEDFVVQDVVGYIDSHYRTLPSPASRGISGLSMGGYGALSMALRRPEVFGLVYALSPALFDPQGLTDSQMFASPEVVQDVASMLGAVAALPGAQREDAFRQGFTGLGDWEKFTFAYGAAFAPAPDLQPPYIQYPYKIEGEALVRDESVWNAWQDGLGGLSKTLNRYQSGSAHLKAIGFEFGLQDENTWIPRGCQYLSQQMDRRGIVHSLQTFQGGHFDHLEERLEGTLLPFFTRELVFQAG